MTDNISPAMAKFNEVMAEYTQAASELAPKNLKEVESFEKKWEEVIKEAEDVMSKELEEELEEANKQLEKEQLASENELKQLEKEGEEREKEMLNKKEEEVVEAQETKEEYLSASKVKKMNEKDLVAYANELGIEAKVSDAKKDTLNKVLDFIGA